MSKHQKYQSAGSAQSGVILAVVGLVIVAFPFIASSLLKGGNFQLGSIAIISFTMLGAVLTILGVLLILLTKLYIKAPANEALVITGMRKKTLVDGGGYFIPMFQELMPVPLETMKLEISKKAEQAFITEDKLRADISAEFFIKIPKDETKIQIAATSLGKTEGITPESILKLVEDKLVSSLRDAVAKKTLEQLHSNRTEFAEEVENAVSDALAQNGLELESVTISNLDQADYANLDLNNVFNAQGAMTVAAITEPAKKKKVEVELANRLATESLRVENEKELNKKKIEEAQSNAQRDRDIMIANSTAQKEAREKAATLEEAAETAEIQKARAVEVATIEKERTLELALIEKEKALAVQMEEKMKAREVAEIARQVEIAQKREEEAAAEAKANKAKALAQQEEEEVETVKVAAKAKRDKIQKVIAQEAAAEQAKILANNEADVKAYETETLAAAEKKSAEDKAAAITAEAEAEKSAAIARAIGKKAEDMIPVEVQRETVKVEADRVKVLEQELKAKSDHAEVSVRLETNLAEIAAEREIGIAKAKSMGEALAAANIQIYGNDSTIDSVYGQFVHGTKKAMFLNTLNDGIDLDGLDSTSHEMVKNYLQGQEAAMLTEGFFENAPEEIVNLLKSSGGSIAAIVALGAKLLGRSPKDEEVEKLKAAVQQLKQLGQRDEGA